LFSIVTKDGKANWSIAKPDTAAAIPGTDQIPFQLNLQSYTITNGYLKYDDAGSNMSSEIINLNHSGSGDFTSDLFTLSTKTSINLDIQVDNKTNKYSFKTDKITLNELKLTSCSKNRSETSCRFAGRRCKTAGH
jgi:hypothetical protein